MEGPLVITMGLRFPSTGEGSPPLLIRRLRMPPRWQSATLKTLLSPFFRPPPPFFYDAEPFARPPARYDSSRLSSGGGGGPAPLDSLLWRRTPLRPSSSSALSLCFFVRVSSEGEIVPNSLFCRCF
ncbi:hypothetical protein OPV22_030650 [Ensete ventricosum]|uniref:Uncharacterized protein n=1 Tax=Ensete ventricosum TaxID=4639 RepID=A0AAV8Q4Q8_ENSVE|nr:hypothetical protein OPV22_030650 [Ensete ventricosum]